MMIIEFFKKLMALRVLFYYAGQKPVAQEERTVYYINDVSEVELTEKLAEITANEVVPDESEEKETEILDNIVAFVEDPIKYDLMETDSEFHDEIVERAIRTAKHEIDSIHWMTICGKYKLSEEFMEKHKDDVNWSVISGTQKLSPEFIERHMHRFSMRMLLQKQSIPLNIIENMIERNYIPWYETNLWYTLSEHQNLDDAFAEKYKDKLSWRRVRNASNRAKNTVSASLLNKYNHLAVNDY